MPPIFRQHSETITQVRKKDLRKKDVRTVVSEEACGEVSLNSCFEGWVTIFSVLRCLHPLFFPIYCSQGGTRKEAVYNSLARETVEFEYSLDHFFSHS